MTREEEPELTIVEGAGTENDTTRGELNSLIERWNARITEEMKEGVIPENVVDNNTGKLTVRVRVDDGSYITVDPENDKTFTLRCKKCLRYKSNLAFRPASQLRFVLSRIKCLCGSKDFDILVGDFKETATSFGIDVKEFPNEDIEYIVKNFLSNVAISREFVKTHQ